MSFAKRVMTLAAMIKHLSIKVTGQVQGVTFRYSAKLEADKLNIKGFAKNEDDGSVLIEAEGEEQALEDLINWCKEGPDQATVHQVKISPGTIQNYSKFSTH